MLQTDNLNDPYNKIKLAICGHVPNQEKLNEVKNCFKHIIPPRRLHYARTMNDILDVLERRGILSRKNVECLHELSSVLNNDAFNAVLISYKKKLLHYAEIDERRFENKYAIARINRLSMYEEEIQRKKLDEIIETKPEIKDNYDSTTFSDKKKKTSYDLIANEIGKRWRDLGRELSIREGELDNIDDKYRTSTKPKVYEILRLFEEKNDPKKIVILLLNALENARRKDLRRNVEDILIR